MKSADVREKIESAFKRSAEIDARRISVVAKDGKIILSGNVHSGQSAWRRNAQPGRPRTSSWSMTG